MSNPWPVPPHAIGPTTQQGTDTPVLSANIINSTFSPFPFIKVEWQWASDAGFTTNTGNYVEPDSALAQVGTIHNATIPDAQRLSVGTWYVRARAVPAANGGIWVASDWSPYVVFPISHPPKAINMSPSSLASTATLYGSQVFAWGFNDTDPGDTQTAYQIIIYDHTLTPIVDTTKVTSPNNVISGISIAVGHKGEQLYWSVTLWDRDGQQGPVSDLVPFVLADAPVITVTAPTGAITNPTPTVTWTYSDSTAGAFYEVIIYDVTAGGTVVYLSGVLAGNPLSFALPSGILKNSNSYTVQVNVTDGVGLTSDGTHAFTTAWSSPAAPSFTVDPSPFATLGYVTVAWTNASKDSTWVAWWVFRRRRWDTTVTGFGGIVDPNQWELIDVETVNSSNYTFHDYAAGDLNDYKVVQVATRFGANVLSDPTNVQTNIAAINSNYSLFLASNLDSTPASSYVLRSVGSFFLLEGVTSDAFDDEYDTNELHLLGRGRRVEYSTKLGVNGSLTVHLTDTAYATAREKRQIIAGLKDLAINESFDLMIRTPFGDVYTVDVDKMNFAREAGLSVREYGVLTIPYMGVLPNTSTL